MIEPICELRQIDFSIMHTKKSFLKSQGINKSSKLQRQHNIIEENTMLCNRFLIYSSPVSFKKMNRFYLLKDICFLPPFTEENNSSRSK